MSYSTSNRPAKPPRRGGRQAATLPFVRRHGEHGGTDDAEGEIPSESRGMIFEHQPQTGYLYISGFLTSLN